MPEKRTFVEERFIWVRGQGRQSVTVGEGVVGRAAPLCGGCLLILGWMGSSSVGPPRGYYQTHPKVGPTAACSVRSNQADSSITHPACFLVRLCLGWNPKGMFYSKITYGSQTLEIKQVSVNW